MYHRINFLTEKEKYRNFYKRVIDNGKTMTDVLNEFIDNYLTLNENTSEAA